MCRFEFHIYLYYINIFTHPILKYSSIQFWIKLTFLIANIALLSALRILVFNQSAQERKQLKEGERWRNMTLCVAVLSIYILFISLSLSLYIFPHLSFSLVLCLDYWQRDASTILAFPNIYIYIYKQKYVGSIWVNSD